MTTTYQPKTPIWCAGCGHFGVQGAIARALRELAIPSADTMILAGIGCSGTVQNNLGTYGFHALHGRVLPAATGTALADPSLTVIALPLLPAHLPAAKALYSALSTAYIATLPSPSL